MSSNKRTESSSLLLVGDDTIGRQALSTLLQSRLGVDVSTCSSSTCAVTQIREERPQLVIFCACEPDGLHGEVLKTVRAELQPPMRLIWIGPHDPPAELSRLVDDTIRFDQSPDRVLHLLSEPNDCLRPARRPAHRADLLTQRELNVLEAMSRGITSNRDLAAELGISQNTVKFHVRNLLTKLDLHKRAELVAYALSRPGDEQLQPQRSLPRAV